MDNNIHLTPADQPGRLWLETRWEKHLVLDEFLRTGAEYVEPKNVHITSNETIVEGDWYINVLGMVCYADEDSVYFANNTRNKDGSLCRNKIIITTDQELVKHGIQAIDDEFLKWYIKNSDCEKVEVIKMLQKRHGAEWHDLPNQTAGREIDGIYRNVHKIIIPKVNPEDIVLGYKTSVVGQNER